MDTEQTQLTSGPLVYYAEDDPVMARMFERVFRLNGCRVVLASDGDEAVQKLESLEERPSVIVLDVMMPKKSGFEALSEIKAHSRYCDVPVVMLTNLSEQKDLDKAEALGANGYIVKSALPPNEIVTQIIERITM